MTLRSYLPADVPAIARLYHDTIHAINVRDYTQDQVDAWAPAQPDLDRWRQKLAGEQVIVADQGGELVGFCSWTPEGYLDLLFVHHDHQRRGVAQALYGAAEAALRAAGVSRVHTQASLTAQPFFLRQGFTVVKHQIVDVRGIGLANAVMERRLV